MLEELTIPDHALTVLQDGQIQVQEAVVILRDGVRDDAFAPPYRRYVLGPGDDVSGKSPRIVALAAALWTEEVMAAYRAAAA